MEEVHVVGDFNFIGQLRYEAKGSTLANGVGIRLYQAVDPDDERREFLCVEDGATGEEMWYRVKGNQLEPVSLRGLEHLRQNPR